MKLRVTLTLAAVTAAVMTAVVFAFFAACTSVSLEEVVPEAELLSLSVTVADAAGQRVINVEVIPVPIPDEDWQDEEYEVVAADFGTIPVKQASDTENARLNAVVSPGAKVVWGKARAGNRPNSFTDTRVSAEFTNDDFLYFKVTASDDETVNYYRFYSIIASPVKELAGMAIEGRDADKVPQPAASMKTLAESITNGNFRGQVDITRREATDALVAAEPQDATAKIRYAVAASVSDAQAGNFSEFVATDVVVVQDEQNKDHSQAHGTITFADGNILAVEVTAQNGDDVNYYGFMVTAGRMATIASLKLDGVEVVGKGVQHSLWGSVSPGSFSSADQGAGGFAIGIELEDSDGSVDYAVINSLSAGAPSTYSTSPSLVFDDKQALAIRVRSVRNNASDTRYYKVQINLLAGNFTVHPKSAVYYIESYTYQPANAPGQDYNGRILIDATGSVTLGAPGPTTIEPLSFELDRPTTGFTYQWYTANSWYGGYGFDKDGHIIGDPGAHGDAYHPAVETLDEKNNISLHNGGNEFYRLPYAGNPITVNGNSATYTPVIDASRRPFLPGFSNQTQYYWVEITDNTGRKVTSKRAAIVSEWGYKWDMGKPTTEKVTKKHHIVNLYAYLDTTGNTPGLQDNPRNVTPFKAGNHGDQYYIPMTFPDGFNINDYSMVMCQALFYLADGREWIQNWTQGDFGFATANKEKLVLWYNLTNDNGTRGLANSGNDPEKSGLNEIPGHLLVQPAGTSPIKQMPPFTAEGVPDKAAIEADGKTAQGWFTPYIEIVELRFEGPAR